MTILIFDFDGTLVQSNEIKINAYLKALPELDHCVVFDLLSTSPGDRYSVLCRAEKKINVKSKLLNFQERVEIYNSITTEEIIKANEVPFASMFLKEARKKEIPMYVSSATPIEFLKEIIYERNWSNYFDGIFGSPDPKSLHVEMIKKYFVENGNTKYEKNLTYLGDSLIDLSTSLSTKINFHGIFFNRDIPEWALNYPWSSSYKNLIKTLRL